MTQGNFIAAEWTEGDGLSFASYDPSTRQEIWRGSSITAGELKVAVDSLRVGQLLWEAKTSDERTDVLRRFVALVKRDEERLSLLVAREVGKPLWEARTEVAAIGSKLDPTLESLDRRAAPTHRTVGSLDSWTRFRALGVAAVIGPFNFPLSMVNTHVMPALLAGNSVIIKPSEHAPALAGEYVKLLLEAGLPSNVISLANGGPEVVTSLVDLVDAVYLTGSRAAGQAIQAQAGSRTDLILALEMGGNSPLVVWDYEELDPVLIGIVQSAFVSGGQRCSAARRLIVPYDATELITALIRVTSNLRVAPALDDPEPFYGPLISEEAVARLQNRYDSLVRDGAKVLLALEHLPELGSGNFVSPGILDVTGIEIGDEEHFGPLLLVDRVASFAEAIDHANATSYGLAAGLYSTSEESYRRFRREIKAGIVNWNQALTGAVGSAPFGGAKDSGNHRPGGSLSIDYCVYAVASLEVSSPQMPSSLPPGVVL